MRIVALCCLSLFLASAFLAGARAQEPGSQNHADWLIVPGERVGPVVKGMTKAQLIGAARKENVREGELGNEAGPYPVTFVYPDDPERKLAITWTEAHPATVATIQICPDSRPVCKWHTRNGITFGTSLKRLERLNGKPFRLTGFGWDYGGTVMDWQGGSLSSLQGCGLGIALEANLEIPGLLKMKRQTAYEEVTGDQDYPPRKFGPDGRKHGPQGFPSDLPAMQLVNPTVDHLATTFECPPAPVPTDTR